MSEKEVYLSIVVPAHNEEKRIHSILNDIVKYEGTHDFGVEIIVVINGSTDKTAEIVNGYKSKIENLIVVDTDDKLGKGGAVQKGMMMAKGKFIIFSDADNSTPIAQADKLLKFAEDFPVVIGSRYCKEGRLAKPQPFSRLIGGRGLNLILQILLTPGIKDTQCGFKLFEREAARAIFKRETVFGWSFDVEILAIAKILGYKIKEAGVIWYDNPHSAVHPVKDALQMISDAWRVRLNILEGRYK